MIRHRNLKFSIAVRLSLARILRQVWRWSVTMDTRYDVISSRLSSHFWVKMHVFQPLLGIKENALDKMMQSNFLSVVLLVKRKKLLIVTWLFLPNFQFLKKCKMATMFGDVTDHQQWIKYTSSCKKVKGFHWMQNRNKGRVHQSHPLPSRPHFKAVRVWLCVYVRGLSRHKRANGEKFGMGLLINKSTCYSSPIRGAGVSTQQFSSLHGNKISVQLKYSSKYAI